MVAVTTHMLGAHSCINGLNPHPTFCCHESCTAGEETAVRWAQLRGACGGYVAGVTCEEAQAVWLQRSYEGGHQGLFFTSFCRNVLFLISHLHVSRLPVVAVKAS